jgi:hypothetical protein
LSKRLFALLKERKATLGPGDEYEIVDVWAEVLGLQGWYEWRPVDGEAPHRPSSSLVIALQNKGSPAVKPSTATQTEHRVSFCPNEVVVWFWR